MSWDIYLVNEQGRAVDVEKFSEGGTYAIGGIDVAELNITYNYGDIFREYLHPEGLRWLHEKKAFEVLSALINALDQLGTNRAEDYWTATKGNAGFALAILARWAKDNSGAKFLVS